MVMYFDYFGNPSLEKINLSPKGTAPKTYLPRHEASLEFMLVNGHENFKHARSLSDLLKALPDSVGVVKEGEERRTKALQRPTYYGTEHESTGIICHSRKMEKWIV